MPGLAIEEILVSFVADMVDTGFLAKRVHVTQAGLIINRASGVVGGNAHHGAGPCCQCRTDCLRLQLEICVGGYEHRFAVQHADSHFLVKIIRQRQDDLVARIGDGEQGVEETHVCPGGDHHFPIGKANAVFRSQLAS